MADGIAITAGISLDPTEIEESFIRASGPGGQNVNKVSTAVQLRFDLMHSPSLPEALKQRAARLARLVAVLREAAIVPKHRRPTRPTLASKQRRLAGKTLRGTVKRLRGGTVEED